MKNKELKRMGRAELLELLVEKSREADRLKIEVLQLKEEIEDLNNRLQDRTVTLDNAGSIAQAALTINGVFESADMAAKQYLDSVKLLSEKQKLEFQDSEKIAREKCRIILEQAAERSEAILLKAKEESKRIETETKSKCIQMVMQANKQADDFWNNAKKQMLLFTEENCKSEAEQFAEYESEND